VTPTTSASSSDGATSASIVELSRGLEVEAKVPEASIARIKPGQSVEIRADAYTDNIFKGRVRLIAPRAVQENNVTSFRVKVALQTGQDKLKAAMNVKLAFIGDSISNALVVPLAAIVTKKDGQIGVLVPDKNNQAQFRPVTVGPTSGDQIQILQGVSKGERILLSPPEGQVIPGVDTVGL
jgi:HlyD family secretion protein